jgi:hypothetical protein
MSEATIQIRVHVSGDNIEVTGDDPIITATAPIAVGEIDTPEPTRIERATTWRRRVADVDPGESEAELLMVCREIGEDRAEAEKEHKAQVQAMHEIKEEALSRGIPMARIAEVMGVSRQWLYSMINHAGRDDQAA